MDFKKELEVIESRGTGVLLRKSWEKAFAGHLTEKEKEEIFLNQFLWHVCSWGKAVCAIGEEAAALFEKQEKDECTIFYQFVDDAYLLKNAKELTVSDLPYESRNMDRNDMYVMDANHTWTFIMTHEQQCGPYFLQAVKGN